MPDDDQFYDLAGKEVAERKFVVGVMARAFADAMGDKEKALALYIRYRVEQLRSEYETLTRARLQAEELARLAAEALKRGEDQKLNEALARAAEEERSAARKIAEDRLVMENSRTTVCKKCGFAGEMRSAVFFVVGHEIFNTACKCPRCGKKFDWYYVPSDEVRRLEAFNRNDRPKHLTRSQNALAAKFTAWLVGD